MAWCGPLAVAPGDRYDGSINGLRSIPLSLTGARFFPLTFPSVLAFFLMFEPTREKKKAQTHGMLGMNGLSIIDLGCGF